MVVHMLVQVQLFAFVAQKAGGKAVETRGQGKATKYAVQQRNGGWGGLAIDT